MRRTAARWLRDLRESEFGWYFVAAYGALAVGAILDVFWLIAVAVIVAPWIALTTPALLFFLIMTGWNLIDGEEPLAARCRELGVVVAVSVAWGGLAWLVLYRVAEEFS